MNHLKQILFIIFTILLITSCGGNSGNERDDNDDNDDSDTAEVRVWENISTGVTLNFNDIAFTNGKFVIAAGSMGGSEGTVFVSDDGVSWTSRLLFNNAALSALASDGTTVVTTSRGKLFTSTDLIDWAEVDLLATDFGNEFDDVVYGNGKFVVIGGRGRGWIFTSDDGATWTEHQSISSGNEDFVSIAYGNGVFVAVGDSMAMSNDGINWNVVLPNIGLMWKVAFGNDTFVAVGTLGAVMTSLDGINWTVQNSSTEQDLFGIDFGNDHFIAGGNDGTFITSNDQGVSWEVNSAGSDNNMRGMAYGNEIYLIVGNNGTILKSQ